MKLSRKLKITEKNYIETCLAAFGCVPVDVDWAVNSQPYKNKLKSAKNV